MARPSHDLAEPRAGDRLLQDLRDTPVDWLDAIIRDDIDPDDRAAYYSSDHGRHRRMLCTVGDLRRLCRIVRAVRDSICLLD